MLGCLPKYSWYSKFLSTVPSRMTGPGTFAANCNEMPSSGWMCSTSWLGMRCSTGVSRNSTKGARRNCITICVFRTGIRLPVRR